MSPHVACTFSHGTSVVVIDLQTDKVVGTIEELPGVHGFAVASDIGRGFASNCREVRSMGSTGAAIRRR